MSLTEAYQPFTSEAEAISIRMDHERSAWMKAEEDAIIDHWRDCEAEQKRYRNKAAIVAWLVSVGLVGIGLALAAMWGA